METEIKSIMEELINKTFKVLKDVYENQREGKGEFRSNCDSRVVFPQNRDGKIRVSEQELRFVFVEQFNKIAKDNNLYYSVETPTRWRYKGFASGNPEPAKDEKEKNTRSGEFDMTIFDQMGNRVCLIEFKAHNVKDTNFEKDFVKLNNSNEGEDVGAYFVLLLEGCDDGTIKSVKEKISEYKDRTHIKCFALTSDSSEVITL